MQIEIRKLERVLVAMVLGGGIEVWTNRSDLLVECDKYGGYLIRRNRIFR